LYRPEWIPYRVTGDIAISINFRPISVSAVAAKNDMREYRDRSHAYASPRDEPGDFDPNAINDGMVDHRAVNIRPWWWRFVSPFTRDV